MVWLVRLIAFTILVGTLGLGACQNGQGPDDGLDPPDTSCIDHDNDTYGVNCEAGLDCDDLDPDIWADCDPNNPCSRPRAGCACEDEGDQIECRTARPVVSPDGSELCYAGVRACQSGLWTTCDSLYSYGPVDESSDDDSDGVRREPLLGHPRPCMGSCDTGCMTIYDCPSQTDFTPETTTNIRYDLPRTVGEGEDAVRLPAATVISDGETEGTFIRTLGAVCGAEEMTQWWAMTWAIVFPEPTAGQHVYIDVRVADAVAGFVPGLAWRNVVECPVGARAGSCTQPENPHDRQFVDDSNLYDVLGFEDARRQWMQVRIRLVRESADAPSPRFMHFQTYFFCGEAS